MSTLRPPQSGARESFMAASERSRALATWLPKKQRSRAMTPQANIEERVSRLEGS